MTAIAVRVIESRQIEASTRPLATVRPVFATIEDIAKDRALALYLQSRYPSGTTLPPIVLTRRIAGLGAVFAERLIAELISRVLPGESFIEHRREYYTKRVKMPKDGTLRQILFDTYISSCVNRPLDSSN
jgi:hypothetical protein